MVAMERMRNNVFSSVDCWWPDKSQLCVGSEKWFLASVQSDVLFPSRMFTTAFSIDQRLWRFWYACPRDTDELHQVAGVADIILYNVHTFLHQLPNSVVDQLSGSTGLFGGHRSGEIKSSVSCWSSWTVSRAQSDTRTCHFRRSYLKQIK